MKSQPAILTVTVAALTWLSSAFALPILDTGHVDGIGFAFEDGAWDLHIHDEHIDGFDNEYAPDGAIFRVLEAARTVVPSDPAFSFLGAPGVDIWVLPQGEDEAESLGVLFLGYGAEEIAPGTFTGDIALSLTAVDFTPESGITGPGDFALYTVDSGGVPAVSMNSADGISAADFSTVPQGGHSHFFWAFSKPGYYRISYRAIASLGGSPVTGDATYSYRVRSVGAPFTLSSVGDTFLEEGKWLTIKSIGSPAMLGGDAAWKVTFKGPGVNSTNDSGILAQIGGTRALIVREGGAAPALADATLKTFGDPVFFPDGSGLACFSAVLAKVGSVTSANDSVLIGQYGSGGSGAALGIVYHEGSAAPGLTASNFLKMRWFRPVLGGGIVFSAQASAGTGRLDGVWRARATSDGFSSVLLAVEGGPLMTDQGLKTVKTIYPPASVSLTGGVARAVDADGSVVVLISFTDGSRELVCFPTVPAVD
jgi:surface-anchored protein